jgi:glycosyltransferase involved in cell wall biosynthesis
MRRWRAPSSKANFAYTRHDVAHCATRGVTMRVAYLQSAASGHTDSCLRALTSDPSVSLFISIPPQGPHAPFASSDVDADVVFKLRNFKRNRALESALREFNPDIILVVSWHHANYRHCLRQAKRSVRVLCMDNQWRATLKQRLGVATAAVHVRPYYDAVFLPGSKQRDFAQRLGFASDRIFEGFYSADVDSFKSALTIGKDRQAFVFVGRLVQEKGIDSLAQAYIKYRQSVSNPWTLLVAGVGPETRRLEQIEGVRRLGFVQPKDLPEVLSQARFLVIPSRFEPFGVVVHEAVSAGLGVICTDTVGAAEHLVESKVNGAIVAVDAPEELAKALMWAHQLSEEELASVADASVQKAGRFSPERWASTVGDMFQAVVRSKSPHRQSR